MTTPLNPQPDFIEITQLIHAARQRAVLAVNTALIELYWQVGQFIRYWVSIKFENNSLLKNCRTTGATIAVA